MVLLSIIAWILTSLLCVTEAGDCFVDFGEEYGKCLVANRFKAANYSECCSFPNASGYAESTSWIIFPEYLFNRKKAQTSCQSCVDYMDAETKNWCFGYRNSADSYCVHSALFSETLDAQDELDCCLWFNASGFTETPDWRWSRSYGRWTTQCNECFKDDFVGCYEDFSETNDELVCESPQSRMSRSSIECCNRRHAKAYDLMERYGNGKRQCFPCPIHGEWSPWSVWSPCSTSCGSGQKRKIRNCNNPSPQFEGKQCDGVGEATANCTDNVDCPVIQNRNMGNSSDPSNGSEIYWSHWSHFSECGVTCGGGTKMRQRICLNAGNESSACDGSDRDVQPCKTVPCSNSNTTQIVEALQLDDGTWSWGPWSPCPQTCGVGIRKRITTCTVPYNARNENGTNVTTMASSEEYSNSNSGCVETTEVGLCELQPCSVQVATNPGVPIAWAVATLAMGTLIVGSIILFCQRRRWDEKMKSYFKRSGSDCERKPRTPADLPPVPGIGGSDVGGLSDYGSMEDLRNRYTTDTNQRSTRSVICQQDDEGYEIPRHESAVEDKHAASENAEPSKDLGGHWGSDGGSNSHVNHVYEQLEFSADGKKISIATQGDSVV